MATLTVTATISYGETTPDGAVPCRIPLSFTLTYTEKSEKVVKLAAGVSDQVVTFDSVTAPKFILVRSLEGDVDVKLDDGVVASPTPSSLSATSGWLMLAHPEGQAINEVAVTTPASPTTGARVEFLVLE